jgi:hypothetical protein
MPTLGRWERRPENAKLDPSTQNSSPLEGFTVTIQNLANILIGLALVGWIVYRQITWRIVSISKMWKKPLILGAVGIVTLSQAKNVHQITALDLGVLVIELVISLAIGAVMGKIAVFRPRNIRPGDSSDLLAGRLGDRRGRRGPERNEVQRQLNADGTETARDPHRLVGARPVDRHDPGAHRHRRRRNADGLRARGSHRCHPHHGGRQRTGPRVRLRGPSAEKRCSHCHDGAVIIYDARSGWVGTLLSLVGAFVIGYFLIPQYATASIAWWVFAAGLIALACWLVVADWGAWNPPVWLLLVASVVMTAFGAIGAAPSNGLLVVPAAVGVLRLIGEPRIDLWIGCAAALMAAALMAFGSFAVTATPLGLLALEGGVALGLLGGINRRQSRAARERDRELIERTMDAREEHARASALEARQRVARDIHDVLAHSLGGMVVQLDAVEALLESGRLDEAESRRPRRQGTSGIRAGRGETRGRCVEDSGR